MKRSVVAAFAVFVSACGAAPPADPSPAASEPKAETNEKLATQQTDFMVACRERMGGAEAYCACGWNLLVDIAGPEALAAEEATREDKAMFEAKIADACVEELTPARVEQQFLAGCTAGGPGREPFCQCMWTALGEKLEPYDIVKGGKTETPAFLAARDYAANRCKDLAMEIQARTGVMKGCVKAPELAPFCECAWGVIRDSHSPAEVLEGTADLAALKPKIKASCQERLPTKKP